MRCDRGGQPLCFHLTPGEAADHKALPQLLDRWSVRRRGPGRPRLRPRALLGDKGCTGAPVRAHLRRRRIAAVIPQLASETKPRLMNRRTCRKRDVTLRLVGRLEEHRRLAVRAACPFGRPTEVDRPGGRLAASSLAFVHLVAIRMWL